MPNVFDVAKYILDTVGGDVSIMKLQKLCYYCQAWHLVWAGQPMFPENFEHWDNGPVCPELFEKHQGDFWINSGELGGNADSLSDGDRRTVNFIVARYGMYDGAQLSELSHLEDPWKNTARNETITNDSIVGYYKQYEKEFTCDAATPYQSAPR
jgi:uncharacterized phage-associated protein